MIIDFGFKIVNCTATLLFDRMAGLVIFMCPPLKVFLGRLLWSPNELELKLNDAITRLANAENAIDQLRKTVNYLEAKLRSSNEDYLNEDTADATISADDLNGRHHHLHHLHHSKSDESGDEYDRASRISDLSSVSFPVPKPRISLMDYSDKSSKYFTLPPSSSIPPPPPPPPPLPSLSDLASFHGHSSTSGILAQQHTPSITPEPDFSLLESRRGIKTLDRQKPSSVELKKKREQLRTARSPGGTPLHQRLQETTKDLQSHAKNRVSTIFEDQLKEALKTRRLPTPESSMQEDSFDKDFSFS
ncbi:uncharacterized protein LOC141857978 [Brevipalpus obovatus]|uniref:uncharacterized protein LOC141857978 n=1 Tax=Brevipalpus obovatus TaxID=246614 RepID=UPI003D9FA05E